MRMLDLCSGLGGASKAMEDRGWHVVRLDCEQLNTVNVVGSVFDAPLKKGLAFDLIWASPPCTEFSRESQPWCKRGVNPDLGLAKACLEVINYVGCRYWIIENVRGAQVWFKDLLGSVKYRYGAYYLWGEFPRPYPVVVNYRKKESYGSRASRERAVIPYNLSLSVALAAEAWSLKL